MASRRILIELPADTYALYRDRARSVGLTTSGWAKSAIASHFVNTPSPAEKFRGAESRPLQAEAR